VSIRVAYNGYGDLVAESHSYASLVWRVEAAGYDECEVLIGKVTP
jgi:hypothetical protein